MEKPKKDLQAKSVSTFVAGAATLSWRMLMESSKTGDGELGIPDSQDSPKSAMILSSSLMSQLSPKTNPEASKMMSKMHCYLNQSND